MTDTVISGFQSTPVTLVGSDTLTVQTSSSLISSASFAVRFNALAVGALILNNGTILNSASGGTAIEIDAGATVDITNHNVIANVSTGSGSALHVLANASATVHNLQVTSEANIHGMHAIEGDAGSDITIYNGDSSHTLSNIEGGNPGGGAATAIFSLGSVTLVNYGAVDVLGGGVGAPAIQAHSVNIENFGAIVGTNMPAIRTGGGTIVNHAGATLFGGVVIDDGSGGNAPFALDLVNDGSISGVTIVSTLDNVVDNGGSILGAQFGGGNDTLMIRNGSVVGTLSGGAGVDTLDYSAFTAAPVAADLAGFVVGVDSSTGFENIIGSSLADTLTGSGENNVLTGNAGDDKLDGGGGADTLIGGAGNDTLDGGLGSNVLDGGTGTNTVNSASATAGVTVRLDLGFGQHSSDGLFDTYTSIENAVGSDFADVIVGKLGEVNVINGGAGDDVILGAGNDIIQGGEGNDVLFGGTELIALSLNLGSDGLETVWGSFVADVMDGSTATANLTLIGQGLTGGVNADTMTGGAGNDFIYYRAGDVIIGGAGNDWAVATLSATGVNLDMTATDFENAWGSTSDDTITAAGWASTAVIVGDAGNDALTGGNAGDFLYGFGDNDTLDGGVGNDNLIGGTGRDTFAFGSNWGTDIVWDWQDGVEKFNMQGSGATSFADLAINQNFLGSGNALISFGANQILVVGGANHIDAGDFIF